MSQKKAVSEYMSRAEIIEITGVGWPKLKGVVRIKSFGFPEPKGKVANNKLMYKRAEVMAWLEKNDIKKMNLTVLSGNDVKKANTLPVIDRELNIKFLSGNINKPAKPAKRRPWTRTIHLKETHPEPPLNPNFTRHSWGDTDHRLSMSADHY